MLIKKSWHKNWMRLRNKKRKQLSKVIEGLILIKF